MWGCAAVLLASVLSGCQQDDAAEPPPAMSFRDPVQPRVSDQGRIRPESFGAVGDGRTDDSAALQQALDTAARDGARVVLAARTYLCDRAIDLPSGTHLSGTGSRSRLLFTWAENTPSTDGYLVGNQDQLVGNQDIVLENFAIEGGGSGLPSGPAEIRENPRVPGIRLRLVERFRISGLEITKVAGISLLYQGSSEGVIEDNHIHDVGRDGITGTWHKRNLSHMVIRDNLMQRIGDDGIALVGAPGEQVNTSELPRDLLVEGNTIEGWDSNPNGLIIGRGIALLAVTRVMVVDNLIDRTHSNGILVAGSTRDFSTDPATGEPWRSSDIRLEGNRVLSAGQNQIGSQPVTADSGGTGILIKSSDRVILLDNEVRDSRTAEVEQFDCGGCYRSDVQ